MFAKAQGTHLPAGLNALRLIEESNGCDDGDVGDIILKYGLTAEQAIGELIDAMDMEAASVRRAAAKTLVRLARTLKNSFLSESLKRLESAAASTHLHQAKLAVWCLRNLKE
jgi:hypothetical protein